MFWRSAAGLRRTEQYDILISSDDMNYIPGRTRGREKLKRRVATSNVAKALREDALGEF